MGEFIIGLTYDLRSDYELKNEEPWDKYAEFDAEETIAALSATLKELGYKVVEIGNIFSLMRFLNEGKRISLVFNIAEGRHGRSREAQIPALLDAFQIPYTFSDPLTLCLCLDKAMAKRILKAEGIPTAEFVVIKDIEKIKTLKKLTYPLFVKPIHEGTGMGIDASCIIFDKQDLEERVKYLLSAYRQPVLVERFLKGREFTVGILGTGNEASVIGIMEIIIKEQSLSGIYGAKAKEDCETFVEYHLADLPGDLEREIKRIALEAHRALNCRDASRIDIRLDERNLPYVLEINPLPGLHPTHSDLPMLAEKTGIPYKAFVEMILKCARRRLV